NAENVKEMSESANMPLWMLHVIFFSEYVLENAEKIECDGGEGFLPELVLSDENPKRSDDEKIQKTIDTHAAWLKHMFQDIREVELSEAMKLAQMVSLPFDKKLRVREAKEKQVAKDALEPKP
ncbi:MAG: hypothetical protein ACF8OB_16605, partial [Phycisphaeraceae bacterium JB051]